MKTKKDWERQRNEAMAALNEIESAEKIQRNTALLGNCYRYRNSYGGDREKWWLYARIVTIDKYGWPTALTFQTTDDKKIEIEPAATRMSFDGWESITSMDFSEAWFELQKRISAIDELASTERPEGTSNSPLPDAPKQEQT